MGTDVLVEPASHRVVGRGRRAALGSIAMVLGSSARFVTPLLIVPLTVGYLSSTELGVLLSVVGLAALLEPLDLGIGSALVTLLARCAERGEIQLEAALIRRSLRLLGVLVVVVASLTLVWTALGDPASAFGVRETNEAATLAIVVGILLFVAGVPLDLVNRANLGYEDGVRVGVVQFSSQAISLVAASAAALHHASVPTLVALLGLGPLVVRTLAWWDLLRRRPHLSRLTVDPYYRREASRQLRDTAALFFLLQLVVAVGFAADQFIIANILGVDRVPEYAVPAKIFGLVSASFSIVARPMWPAFASAAAAGQHDWVIRSAQRLIGGAAVVSAVASAIVVGCGGWLVGVFGRGQLAVNTGTLIVFAVWTVLMSVGVAVSMVLNGLSVVRIQVTLSSVMAVANVVLSVIFTRRWGVVGALWGSIVSYSVTIVIPYMFLLPRLVREALQKQRRSDAVLGQVR